MTREQYTKSAVALEVSLGVHNALQLPHSHYRTLEGPQYCANFPYRSLNATVVHFNPKNSTFCSSEFKNITNTSDNNGI